jgi:hypothetical protein
MLSQTPVERFLEAMAAGLDGPAAEGKALKVNLVFSDTKESFVLWIENAVHPFQTATISECQYRWLSPHNQLSDRISTIIAKGRQVDGPLFAGNRRRVATRKMPTFVLRTRVSSSEKAPKGKFEHRWFGEQPSQQERRQAGHSTSPMSQAEVKLYPVPVQLPQRAISI